MKYIYNRNEFRKVNELINSEDLDVDFGDTLLGGTLHRLLGFGRSAIGAQKMNNYSKQLDKFLASMLASSAGKTAEDLEEIKDDAEKVITANIMNQSMNMYSDGDEEKAKLLLSEVPEKLLLNMPGGEELTNVIQPYDPKSDGDGDGDGSSAEVAISFEKGDKVVYKGNTAEVDKYIDNDTIQIKTEDGIDKVSIKDITKQEDILSEQEEKKIEEIVKKFEEVSKKYESLKKENDRFEKLKNNFINRVKELRTQGWDTNKYNELTNLYEISVKLVDKIESGGVNESYLAHLDIILENSTQKEFDKIRKNLNKASKTWNVSEEELRKLDKEISETKGGDMELSGDQAKNLIGILTKAKDSMLHAKPYDEIRKKQKRYFDKLKSGRAINRKAYQTWSKKVNEILAYYKDKLPKKAIDVISDALDKDEISDDYVKLNKEILGVEKKSRTNDQKSKSSKNSKSTGYIPVKEIKVSNNISLILEVKSDKGSGYVTLSRLGSSPFYKFVNTANSEFIKGYVDNFKGTIEDFSKSNLNTDKYVNIKFNESISKVNIGKFNMSDTLKKGDDIYVSYTNIKDSENIKSDVWNIQKIFVLVADDLKVIETKEGKLSRNDIKVKLKDVKELFYKQINNLSKGADIKYMRTGGDNEVVEAKFNKVVNDDQISVTTEKSTLKINKYQVIL